MTSAAAIKAGTTGILARDRVLSLSICIEFATVAAFYSQHAGIMGDSCDCVEANFERTATAIGILGEIGNLGQKTKRASLEIDPGTL